MNETLTIENVNLKRLDKQRAILTSIPRRVLTGEQNSALDSIVNMLETESDKRYFEDED